MDVDVSPPLAFSAGFVSVLSACVIPVVPGYVAFVSALVLDERVGASVPEARRGAALYSVLFMVGFGLVFLSLGLVARPRGPPIARALPWVERAGGVALALYGLHLTGALGRLGPGMLESRPGTAARVRAAGSLLTGVAFGAGWTPCIGPVLGSILLYVTLEETAVQGTALLVTYAIGLSVPFVALSMALNWPLAGSRRVEAWALPLRRVSGAVLLALGVALTTGYFARLTAFLAGLGQLINLELS